jgi:type III secretory pathway component EscT
MTYIDKLIYEVAEEMAIKELKRTKFLLGIMIGFFLGLAFWAVIIMEIYTLAPFK